jgi:hypothetical protein
MDEEQNRPFQLSFNASLSVDFQRSRVTSEGDLMLIRELDERRGLGELIEQYLTDSRAKNARLPFADLPRQSVYSRLAGKCQRRGRRGRANPHSGSAERPKRAALPPPRDQRDVRLTRRGRRARLSGEGEAQNANSGSMDPLGLEFRWLVLCRACRISPPHGPVTQSQRETP